MKILSSTVLCAMLTYGCTNNPPRNSNSRVDVSVYEMTILEHRKNINEFMKSNNTPIEKTYLANFEGLKYFPVDSSWNLKAKYIPIDTGKVFEMATTTHRVIPMRKHGLIVAVRQSDSIRLFAYQNINHPSEDLFVPFLDATNGDITYGGGRYLEIESPNGDSVWVDFNKAYNPYCAYNHRFSCPVPPLENTLYFKVEAGEKVWLEH